MPSRPLILRLIGPFAVLIVIVIGVCGAVIYWAGERHVRMQQMDDLDRLAVVVRDMLSPEQQQVTAEQSARLKDLAAVLGTRITLIGPDGTILLDTHHNPASMDNHNTRPEVSAARARGIGKSVRLSDTIAENAVYVAERLDPNRPDGIIVRLSFPESVWTRLSTPVWAIVLAATVSGALLMAWLAFVLQRQWIGPVNELANAADEMAAGKWQTRVTPAGAAAVRVLGGRFNVMADRTQGSLEDLKHQRADLQSLVDSLPDPIFLTDADERIAVINAPAARLLQLTPAEALGKRIDVVVNEEAILTVLEELRSSAMVTREIRLTRAGQHVTYQAVATAAQVGGVLLVLRNVSAMAAAVQMKTDFVANASHELRTPLAAIKAAFETLEEVYQDDPDQTARCVAIMAGHLQRLEEMLRDLLDLSRVESSDLKAQIAAVKIEDLVSFVRNGLAPMARGKGVDLLIDAAGWNGQTEFSSDRHLLDLILKNLIENSIKFTPAGGQVTVRIGRMSGAAILEVTDTGIGIPPEHQERVFERFYQVDPARSGSAGRGTGLGLAIVKHAIHALGGSVQLTSAVGVGTKVRCMLPEILIAEEVPVATNDI
jgi:two-component system phosphate regulon sensor histidine kinase PhoR